MLENAITEMLRLPEIAQYHRGVYDSVIPDDSEFPAVSYQIISDKPVLSIDNTGPRKAVIQINCVDKMRSDDDSYFADEQAFFLAKAIRTQWSSLRGVFSDIKIAGVQEQGTHPKLNSDTDTYHQIQDFTIQYEE
ncbi:hypothetical protein [Pseudoalteromonas peptidolytica]|uniref:DUF3168 domain-containing protein n=1 Tax=Pseudoalteromonas peptidolytica F12-50-A1 TaxID=1315280 RepID=A0A8I0N0F0_9GAMM|nr:hypothetical protein [Pseudoalteromonas peptidolytica]MBE0348284.1 hypothetical protein [Pseudoalteromonas peptidolytica F12-50-A1]NLR16569.1 hypothetical protein [Pseudoalteromonas peptidolytica]GEK08939.1 hypothetical protein PPE03_11880 [Pseudoalteromonas peptidolytica]